MDTDLNGANYDSQRPESDPRSHTKDHEERLKKSLRERLWIIKTIRRLYRTALHALVLFRIAWQVCRAILFPSP